MMKRIIIAMDEVREKCGDGQEAAKKPARS